MKENFNVKGKKGSIAIFVLVGLLFMSAFLIISYGYNVNKSKIAKEQFNSISDIYSHKDGDANAYDRAYTALRKKNKQTLTKTVENTSTLELEKTYEGNLVNYRIYGKGDNIPQEYQEVEYISTNGNAFINTGLAISSGYQIELKAQLTVRPNSETWFLGNWMNNPKTSYLVGCYRGKLRVVAGPDETAYYADIPYDDQVHVFSILKDKITVDTNEFNIIPDFNAISKLSNNILLGKSVHYNEAVEKKIYSFKAWDIEGNIVRNFIPCYKKLDNVAGFYEMVNGVFYMNAGTEEFVVEENILEVGKIGDLITDINDLNYGKYNINIKTTNSEGESTTRDIILNNPLFEEDYIDFKTRKVVRADGTEEDINLPELETYEDYTKIEVLTEVVPSRIEVEYTGYKFD